MFFSLVQAKGATGLEPEGAFSTPVSVDASVSEYELPNLKAATDYIVIVKLYNEAGAAEQKFRITTLKEKSGEAFGTFDSNPSFLFM